MRRLMLGRGVALLLVGALAAGPAQATEVPDPVGIVGAIADTETSNIAHYQDVADTAATAPNVTCRVDKPVFVNQPEIDSRVTVKGQDTAAATIECADIMLEATDQIEGVLYIQYETSPGNWELVLDTWTRGETRMVRGVGSLVLAVDYVYPANDPSQGKPHRACVQLRQPYWWAPLCTALPTAGPLVAAF